MASTPASCSAIDSRPTLTCSPVDAIMSSSRGLGCGEISFARPSRRLVSPDIAEGTTTILWPALCHLATRLATFLMRSTEPIEVPPYLCTMSAIVVLNWRRNRADAPRAEPRDCRSVSRPREHYDD